MNNRTKDLVLAALLTALSLILTFSPLKLQIPPFTMTLGVHVPTLIAMFINPWVVVMTTIGSCMGFLMVFPGAYGVIVMLRSLVHLAFALPGYYMIKSGKLNIFLILLITSVLHAATDGLVVLIMTPVLMPAVEAVLTSAGIAFAGTFIHHYIDSLICVPVLLALQKAKMVHTSLKWKSL